ALDAHVPLPSDATSATALSAPCQRRVLVVDDHLDAAESLATLLRLTGHEVRTVDGGLQVADEVRRFAPDAVLLDIGLPGLNGYEVARRLRQALGPALLLIACSGC